MAICPFATWLEITGPSGGYAGGPFKVVHHTTEGARAEGAFDAFKNKQSDPHFTVDATAIYQHIDTDQFARSLKNADGGVQTNRDSAVQIEVVGFAHLPKGMATLTNVARLCRWIEQTHGVERVWPNGYPKTAVNGHDPGGHNRDAQTWDSRSGHYGHCHVPENDHWDPGYTMDEVEYVMTAGFDHAFAAKSKEMKSLTERLPSISQDVLDGAVSTMPDHSDVETNDDP